MSDHYTVDRGVDRAFTVVNYVILTLFLVAVAYPLIYVFSATAASPPPRVGCRWSNGLS